MQGVDHEARQMGSEDSQEQRLTELFLFPHFPIDSQDTQHGSVHRLIVSKRTITSSSSAVCKKPKLNLL